MNDGLIYETVESGYEILKALYLNNPTNLRFSCSIYVQFHGLDANEPGTLELLVTRMVNRRVSFVHPNGDKIYSTKASFTENSPEFAVNITIHSRNADTTGATVTMSDEALYILRDIRNKEQQ